MFPFFGWTRPSPKDHTPRFPVADADARSTQTTRTLTPDARGHHRPGRPRPTDRSAPESGAARADEGDDADMSAYREFTGKSVEEALQERPRGVRGRARRPGLRDPDAGQPGRPRAWAPSRPGSSPRRARRSAAPPRSARPRQQPLPPPPPREPAARPRPAIATAAPAATIAGPRRDDRAATRPRPVPAATPRSDRRAATTRSPERRAAPRARTASDRRSMPARRRRGQAADARTATAARGPRPAAATGRSRPAPRRSRTARGAADRPT